MQAQQRAERLAPLRIVRAARQELAVQVAIHLARGEPGHLAHVVPQHLHPSVARQRLRNGDEQQHQARDDGRAREENRSLELEKRGPSHARIVSYGPTQSPRGLHIRRTRPGDPRGP